MTAVWGLVAGGGGGVAGDAQIDFLGLYTKPPHADSVTGSDVRRFAAWDSARAKLVYAGFKAVYGNGNQFAAGVTHEWDRTTQAWAQITAEPVPPGAPSIKQWFEHGLVYDPVRQKTYMFAGGYQTTGGSFIQLAGRPFEWNGAAWTDKNPAAPIPPNASTTFRAPVAIFDEVMQKSVVVGSTTGGGTSETWLWDGTGWTYHSTAPNGPPTTFNSAHFAWDPDEQKGVFLSWVNVSGLWRVRTWIWTPNTGWSASYVADQFLNLTVNTASLAFDGCSMLMTGQDTPAVAFRIYKWNWSTLVWDVANTTVGSVLPDSNSNTYYMPHLSKALFWSLWEAPKQIPANNDTPGFYEIATCGPGGGPAWHLV